MIFFRRSKSKVPQIVDHYLLPHEKQVIIVHKHLGIFALHGGILAVALAAAGLLSSLTNSSGLVLGFAWGACFIIFAWLIIRLVVWSLSYFVVTHARMIFITGLIVHKVITVPLVEIHDLSYYRPLLGRLLGYGVFVAEVGTDNYPVPDMKFMPYPEQLYLEMCALMFDADDLREYEPETEP